jgi:uncharacterized protein
MTENITISKAAPAFTSMNFALLREIGIKHFEKMGSKLWTDYNLHDPGITILEVLCYAITDLGYRTNFSIEDILAASGNSSEKQFFDVLEILTCNAVTANDFRKILIDLKGIKNAWLVKTAEQEMPLFAGKDANEKWTASLVKQNAAAVAVKLNGLYDVYLDLEDDVDQKDLDRVDDIVKCAWQKLWKHRNLCEDFVKVNVIEEMEFGIEVQVELCADADVNKVAGDIYYYIQEFLTPTIPFYSFKEMYEVKKKLCDEIFEGPVLCNGFIDDDELDKAQLRKEIYLSDLWQVVMDVCGVAGIKKLIIKKCDGEDVVAGEVPNKKWCLKIDPYHKPKLSLGCSTISFQKEFDCIYADDRKVKERILLQQKLHQPVKKTTAMPLWNTGTNRNLEEYFTIQNEFPFTYKIADGQIIERDTVLRKAQSKQLKGYLTLFDELLSNYLMQLSRVKDLLSVSQPEEHSYFYQTLYNVPGIKELIKAFPENGTGEDWQNFIGNDTNDYIKQLQQIIESPSRQKQRKNIFLDHLLARFGEVFSGYVIKQYEEQCNCSTKEGKQIGDKILKDKAAFLKNIPELSSERGKGFNYKALDCGRPDVWDTNNVEGVKKRICAYLGHPDHKRKTLTCPPEFDIKPYRVITDGRVQVYRLRLEDDNDKALLEGLKDYKQQQNAVKDAKDLKEQIVKGNVVISSPPDANGFVRLYVKDREDNYALQSEMITDDDAKKLKKKIEELAFPGCCAIEGFHVVEHILLRAKDDDYTPLFDPVMVLDMLSGKTGTTTNDLLIEDGYSFWITVVVPNWLPQFKNNTNGQNQFEQLVRRETPAHIAVRFCWLGPKEMYHFESAYLKWLYENALEQPNERELTEHTNNLVSIMRQCNFTLRAITEPCSGTELKESKDQEKYN